MIARYLNAYLWRRYTASLTADPAQLEYSRTSGEMQALGIGGVLVLASLTIGWLLINGGAR